MKDFEKLATDYYEFFEEIGSGRSSVVRRAVERDSGRQWAAKQARRRRSQARQLAEREAGILRRLGRHDHIAGLHDVCRAEGGEPCLLLELVPGGELFHHIADFSEAEAALMVAQLLSAVRHMHGLRVVHLDLKPENLLLQGRQHLKVVDFGLARELAPGLELRETQGTAEFVAPEVINYDPVSLATDMWSVGVITFMLLTGGSSPFLGNDKQRTFSNISVGKYHLGSDHASQSARDFVSALLVRDPRKRLTAEQSLDHRWILSHLSAIPSQPSDPRLRNHWKKIIRAVVLCIRLSRISKLLDSPAPRQLPRPQDLASEHRSNGDGG